jgi:hypothetical protein
MEIKKDLKFTILQTERVALNVTLENKVLRNSGKNELIIMNNHSRQRNMK